MSSKTKITIDIVSDVVCPWCYIGKRRLEQAMERASGRYDFEITYKPFELNPDTPSAGLNQKEHLTSKFGGDERYEQLTENTTSVADSVGLKFNFDDQKIIPNTRNLHAVIQLAKEEGKQLLAVEAFFKAYFTDGVDLSKKENILKIAASVGLEAEKVEKVLTDEQVKLTIASQEKETAAMGIRSVPFFIVNNRFGISGAQMSETFIKAFEEISSQAVPAGEACDATEKNC